MPECKIRLLFTTWMDFWEYHAKWNWSDGESQEPNDFSHMISVGYKTESSKQDKQIKTDTDKSIVVIREKEGRRM